MCGIAGVLALGDRPPDPAWGALLVSCLRHRGPDGNGVYADRRVLLAHTRLAIIDTGSGGAQPMHSRDGRHVIVQNGEIYNYRELVPELAEQGVTLKSHSDTEVLLERIARDGPRGLEALRGMWAFALWDRERETLLLCRDRLGKKPIVWTRTPEYFAFASEAKALLALPFVRARLARESLADWLSLLYVPAPRTLLEGVHKLPAASWLEVSARDPGSEPVRWWRLPGPDRAQRADRAWFEALDRELLEAVRLRTVSDVPIGLLLSGGVDSNVVLEALHRTGHGDTRTYTLGFAGLPDERARAAIGARRFGGAHVERVLDPDIAREIEPVLAQFGEPLGDSAVVTSALVAREAARHVKVVLNGDGGDELFGGYPRYPWALRADRLSGVPGALALLRLRYHGRANAEPALARLASGEPLRAARSLGAICDGPRLAALLSPGLERDGALPTPDVPGAAGPGLVDALFAWDTGAYLPDDLLVKVDVACMAHGLENRSPLLDHRLFEHVARLTPARRLDLFETKPLLRRYARGRIAPEAIAAPKQGFQLPLHAWLSGALRPWLDQLLLDPAATAAVIRPAAVRAELEQFHAGRGDALAPYRLWSLAVLEWWARRFRVAVGP